MTTLRSPSDLVSVLRERRRELRETQAQFAARIGRTQAWVSAFERGVNMNVYASTLFEVLAAAGLTVDVGAAAPSHEVAGREDERREDAVGDFATGFEDDDDVAGCVP